MITSRHWPDPEGNLTPDEGLTALRWDAQRDPLHIADQPDSYRLWFSCLSQLRPRPVGRWPDDKGPNDERPVARRH